MINLIFAIDPNGLIGKGNDLPWHYPEDLRYFKQRTMGKTVLMGLETFKSIIDRLGHPLPGRNSIVASLEPFSYPGVTVIDDVVAFFEDKHDEDIFVIGGKTIYKLAFPYADRLYITHVKKAHQGDVYLNGLDLDQFELIESKETSDLVFAVYRRK